MISNYKTIELYTDRLILKKGIIEDYIRVYEYDFRKLRNILGEMQLEKQNSEKLKVGFKMVLLNITVKMKLTIILIG